MSVYILAFVVAVLLASLLPARFTLRVLRMPAERAFGAGTYNSRLAGHGAMIGAVAGLLGAMMLQTTMLFIGPTTSFLRTVVLLPIQDPTAYPLTMLISRFFERPELILKVVSILLKGFALHVLPEIVLLALIGAGGGLLHRYIRRPNGAVPA